MGRVEEMKGWGVVYRGGVGGGRGEGGVVGRWDGGVVGRGEGGGDGGVWERVGEIGDRGVGDLSMNLAYF